MAKPNAPIKNLTRYFDKLESPVYLLSVDSIVLYANEACAKWVGLNRDVIVGIRCIYSSNDCENHVEERLQGLCPPPEYFETENSVDGRAVFFAQVQDGGQSSWRKASCSRLFDANGQLTNVLVACESVLPEKPISVSHRQQVSAEAIHNALQGIRSRTRQTYSLDSLVGSSIFASHLQSQVTAAVKSEANLLISGPRGSGKEHFARTIHHTRNKENAELIPVHCSIADQALIQQNIKDIVANTTSRHESNSPRCLLLLDVDRLGEASQTELLGFFRLPDFTLNTLATSSDPLLSLAEANRFSKELAFKLSTSAIDLPALKQRPEDIPLLAQSLLERHNSKRAKQKSGFSDEVIDLLVEYEWPENIDELNRVIQSAVDKASHAIVGENDLPDDFLHALKAQRIGTAQQNEIDLNDFMSEIERELITRALGQAKGNKTKAAKLLGISRGKLLRRIQQLELKSEANEIPESAFEELEGSEAEE